MDDRPKSGRWWREEWMELIYSDPGVKPLEVLVALTYADHARDGVTAWVTRERLASTTHMSLNALNRAIRGLEEKGYLRAVEKVHRRPVTYRLQPPLPPAS